MNGLGAIPSFGMTLLMMLRDVLPIAAILFGFQILVLRRPIPNLPKVLMGFFYVLLGLTFFLEGLELALEGDRVEIVETRPLSKSKRSFTRRRPASESAAERE